MFKFEYPVDSHASSPISIGLTIWLKALELDLTDVDALDDVNDDRRN